MILTFLLGNMYVYIHNNGEFMEKNARSDLLPLISNKFEVNIELKVEVKQFLSTNQMTCNKDNFMYDKCMTNETINQLGKVCIPAFIETNSNISKCSSFDEGLKALYIFNAKKTICDLPCTQINIEYSSVSSQNIYSYINPNTIISENPGYHFVLPKTVPVTETTEEYGIISYIAEFGGWSGLFIGISILGLYSTAEQTLKNLIKKKVFDNILKSTLILASLIVYCFVCFTSVSKLVEEQTETDIGFTKNYTNVHLSICSEESIYNQTNYLGGSVEFWRKGSDISKKIYMLEIKFKDGSSGVLRTMNHSLPNTFSSHKIEMHNLPTADLKIQFCHTLDVSHVKLMKIKTYKEIFLYLHMDQQLFGKYGKSRLTVLPEQSIYIKNKKSYLKNTLSRVSLTHINNIREAANDVDDCITQRSQLRNVLDTINPLSIDTITHGIEEELLKSEINAMKSEDYQCPDPQRRLQAEFGIEMTDQSVPLIINTKPSNYFQERQATVFLQFPSFSMFYKVVYFFFYLKYS